MGIAGNIAKGSIRILTAPVRWLVKAPLRFALGLVVLLLVAVVVAPNAIMVLGQRPNFRTIDQLVDEVTHPLDGLPASENVVPQPSGQYDCIMVLGAAVRPDGTPSPILADRIQVAVDLYNAGIAPKIVMSGDNQSDRETYDEVANMKRYAVEDLGVPSEDVFCDHAGINTYDSAYRIYHVFGSTRTVVVTQSYHLYRALFDTNSFHVQAVGVPSDLRVYQHQFEYDVREMAARVSDMWKVIRNANATYLSEPVSLDQSGDVTSWKY